jgi:RNA polymerase-binding transcription factor
MTRNFTPVDIERQKVLRAMLEERRTEIHEKLRSLRETLPAEVLVVKDAEEQSMHDFVQDVELALVEMKSETLARIDEALHQLEKGHYGICADCGVEIAEARLRAVPFATRCLTCQEQAESEERERAPERASRELALVR